MREVNLTILKIGGSAITNKESELQVRMDVINRLAREVHRANIQSLVIVHGGGSFGHPTAERHAIAEGFSNQRQISGFAETHHMMTVLNGLFMDAMIWREIPAVSLTPLSFVVTRNRRIEHFYDKPLSMSLDMGLVPVLYGDAVVDSKMGFTILSGDQLVSALALHFGAKRIIMGVDVDGLYDVDPRTCKSAKIFEHLTFEELTKIQDRFGEAESCDVTGGMYGKVQELLPAIERGIPVTITNATKENAIYKALVGQKTTGTLIEKE